MFADSLRQDLLSLLAAIKSEPDDDTAKLALADWLEEQDHASDRARGQYLRAILACDRLPEDDPVRRVRRARIQELWRNHPAWLGPLPATGFHCSAHATRWGLLFAGTRGTSVISKKALAVAGSEEYAWVGGLSFESISSQQNRQFVRSPLLESLIALRYDRCALDAWAIEELASAPRAAGLKSLSLTGVPIGSIGMAALAGSPEHHDPREGPVEWQLGALRELNLNDSDIGGDDGYRVLCHSQALRNLRSLNVTNTRLSIHSARSFVDGAGLPALTDLDLSGNGIGPDGTLILVHKEAAGRLRKLNLRANGVADYGVEAICRQRHMGELTHLDLSGNLLTDRAAFALASAEHLNKLEELHLRTNEITDSGAIALAGAQHLLSLRQLDLSSNSIGPDVSALLRERYGDRVRLK